MIPCTDAGCWADGCHGHRHVRMVMANVLANLYRHHPRGGEGTRWATVGPICEALDGEMSDDAWEEEAEALEWLNKACEQGCYFDFVDGDLLLICDDESEAS